MVMMYLKREERHEDIKRSRLRADGNCKKTDG